MLKVWRVGKQESAECRRLLLDLAKVLEVFLKLMRDHPDSYAYRYPFRPYDSEPEFIPFLIELHRHLDDTNNILKKFAWDDEQIDKFVLVRAKLHGLKPNGAECVDGLYIQRALLRGIEKKWPVFDIERRLKVANRDTTGAMPLY